MIQLNADPQVMRFVENGRPLDIAEAAADHARRLSTAYETPGLGHWAGFHEGQFIGWWALTPSTQSNDRAAELGYRLLPDHWRKGFTKEGAKEILRHGFEELGLDRVWAQTMAVNVASRRTMQACGMRYVRTFHVEFEETTPGTEEGEVEYCITKAEWLASGG